MFRGIGARRLRKWKGAGAPQMPPARGLQSLPLLNVNSDRDEILKYFNNSWDLTEQLYAGLAQEDAYYHIPYHRLRHPFVFYTAHSAALYDNKFHHAGLIKEKVNSDFATLFEAGVDEMSWDNLHDHDPTVFPAFAKVQEYRDQVHKMVTDIIKNHPCLDEERNIDNEKFWAVVMGFEHDKIHMETSSVLIREMPLSKVKVPDGWPMPHDSNYKEGKSPGVPVRGKDYPLSNDFVKVEPTTVKLGRPKSWPTFGWDNSYGEEVHEVRAFSANQNFISNGEYYEFVADGGYQKEKYWTEDSWNWKKFRDVGMPTFWRGSLSDIDKDGGLRLRMIFEEAPMQWDWPVIVNYHEAKAYSRWKSEKDQSDMPYRLITEKEHNAMRSSSHSNLDVEARVDSILQPGPYKHVNFNLQHGSESSVTAFEPNEKGFRDVFGNVWSWCEDHFHPLSGFKEIPLYPDFSLPCYDSAHFMILGGSFISTGDNCSVFMRSHFRPHFYQHAGFRLARYEDGNPSSDAVDLG